MGTNLRGEHVPDITLERARELGLAVETVRIAGVCNATGYAGKTSVERIELGERARDWRAWIRI